MEKPTREQAIKVIEAIFDRAFGNDKGSNDAYCEFMENMGLAKYDDDYNTIEQPPGMYDIMMALGITADELVSILHLNPKIFKHQPPAR